MAWTELHPTPERTCLASADSVTADALCREMTRLRRGQRRVVRPRQPAILYRLECSGEPVSPQKLRRMLRARVTPATHRVTAHGVYVPQRLGRLSAGPGTGSGLPSVAGRRNRRS